MLRILILTIILFMLALGCSQQPSTRAELEQRVSMDKIIGGHEIKAGEFGAEFVVMIYSENELGEPSICTGSFISEAVIITAAHCVPKKISQMSVVFSDNPFGSSEVVRIAPIKALIHPNYKKGKNDLAVIFFSGGLPSGAKTISLARRPWLILGHQHIFALGYGRTEGLEGNTDFSEELGVLRGTSIVTKNTMAKIDGFYTVQKTNGVCFGDSGGPAIVVDKNSLPVLVGVANAVISSPDIQDFCKHKSVYTDVGFYFDWLRLAINLGEKLTTK